MIFTQAVQKYNGSARLYEDQGGGYMLDQGGYMWIRAVIYSGEGARDTCVSKKRVPGPNMVRANSVDN